MHGYCNVQLLLPPVIAGPCLSALQFPCPFLFSAPIKGVLVTCKAIAGGGGGGWVGLKNPPEKERSTIECMKWSIECRSQKGPLLQSA